MFHFLLINTKYRQKINRLICDQLQISTDLVHDSLAQSIPTFWHFLGKLQVWAHIFDEKSKNRVKSKIPLIWHRSFDDICTF